MPELGDIKEAKDLGYKGKDNHIYAACVVCGRRRWVEVREGKPRFSVCFSCRRKLEKAKKVCMFCLKPITRGGREVAIYGAYAPIREGRAHGRCLNRYLDSVERGKGHLALPCAGNKRSLIELAEEAQTRLRENSRSKTLEGMIAKRK